MGYWGYRYYSAELGRWLSRDPMGEKSGINYYIFIMNNGLNKNDLLGLIDITNIPRIMIANNFTKGAALMNKWFSAPAGQQLDDTTTITMDWALNNYPRAKAVYDSIFQEKIYQNDAAKKVILKNLRRSNATNQSKFGYFSWPVHLLEEEHINFRPVGSLYDPIDDLFAALGKFRFHVVISGTVDYIGYSGAMLTLEKVGVFIVDSYDFNDEDGGDQPLGFWNERTNYVGRNPFRGDYVSNSDFREYQQKFNKGGNFIIFSDLKVTTLNPREQICIFDMAGAIGGAINTILK
ncbi:MAG: hypothetical protein HQK76_21155 [Desulfobacterales bacterium]|nr:hypothetical protein [Desulfobacterales bacterium]